MRDLRVCFVGDSFVAGVGDSSALGWTGRLTAAAIAQGRQHDDYELTAYNLGVRRDTARDIAARIAAETYPRLRPADDPRVVLSFGVNDTAAPESNPADTLNALHMIYASMSGARLFLVGPPAIDDEAHNARIALLSTALEGEAGAMGLPFVPTFEVTSKDRIWRQQVREGDGAHPDSGGYEVLAGLVTDPLLGWLAS